MRAHALARLAVAGNRTNLLRTVLTVVSAGLATVALLGALTVTAVEGDAERYASPLLVEPGLRPGVVTALVLLALPVLALAGQCIRLGAPARDRRLAALRLSGATPGETVLVATTETAVAAALGSVLGSVAYLVAQRLGDQRNARGLLLLPTDIRPSIVAVGALLAGVPLIAALLGAVLMRRVIVTPLGVVRRTRERGPRPWPGMLLAAGLALFWLPTSIRADWHVPNWLSIGLSGRAVMLVLLGSGVALSMLGVVLGTAWISHTTGRLLRRSGRGPAVLLAAKRLMADPWHGSRTMAALLTTVIAGAIALGYRAFLATQFAAQDRFNALNADPSGPGTAESPEFYYGAIRLVMVAVAVGATVAAAGVLVALAEGVVARRRTYATLTAVGVARRTLAASVLWHTLAPLVPTLLIALSVGTGLARLLGTVVQVGGDYEACVGSAASPPDCVMTTVHQPLVVMDVPVPLAHLALLGGAALLAVLVAVGAGLLVLRSSTDLEELRVG